MAHQAQFDFMEKVRGAFPQHFRSRRVLEIGSLDINGSVRRFFDRCEYVGLDVAPGPGVDVVCAGQAYAAPGASFDVVLSCEAMEHNPHWIETMRNMVRLCRPDGLIIMTCATTGRDEHGTTRSQPSDSPLTVGIGWEYYRNLTAQDIVAAGVTKGLGFSAFFTNWHSHDLYMLGAKAGISVGELRAVRRIGAAYQRSNFGTFRGVRNFLRARLAVGAGRPGNTPKPPS